MNGVSKKCRPPFETSLFPTHTPGEKVKGGLGNHPNDVQDASFNLKMTLDFRPVSGAGKSEKSLAEGFTTHICIVARNDPHSDVTLQPVQ